MNESIAMVKANVTLLEKEEAKYKTDMANLTAKIKAAIQAGRDDIAGTYAQQLEQLKGAFARNQGQLQTARAAFDKAMAVKQAFMREKDRKTQEALNAIADYRRSQGRKKSPTPWSSSKSLASARRTTRWSARLKRRRPSTKLAWIWP